MEIRDYCNGVDVLHTQCTFNQTCTHSSNCQTASGASKHARMAVSVALLRFAIERLAELRGSWRRRLAVTSTIAASATMMVVFVTEG